MIWNFGDIFDALLEVLPKEYPALIHGSRATSWGDLDRRSNNLVKSMYRNGAKAGDRVCFYMRNRSEYMETLIACFRGRLTHVNVNYRYVAEEIKYIIENSNATVVVYAEEFREIIDTLQDQLPNVKQWIEIEDQSPPKSKTSYEFLVQDSHSVSTTAERSPSDQLFIYTGGTTGLPKAVMWDHHNLREALLLAARAIGPVPENIEELKEKVLLEGPGERMIPACPLMHGTGLLTAINAICNGGTVITLESPSLDAPEILQAIEEHKVNSITIVGDAFAQPILTELDKNPERYDLSSLKSVISSGVMWSQESKKHLLRYIPQAALADSFGSSEALGFGTSITTAEHSSSTAKFITNDYCKVFDEDNNEIPRGSEKPGFIAFGGPIPVGYYGDKAKTAKTFKTINGHRYSIPGDYCTVAKDGTLTLLGRGSSCINSAGEKIYPEEVEEVIKRHHEVRDVLVVGVPDPRWGQIVVAVVELENGFTLDEDRLKDFASQALARYKLPKAIFTGGPPFRAPNGKANYKQISEYATQLMAANKGAN